MVVPIRPDITVALEGCRHNCYTCSTREFPVDFRVPNGTYLINKWVSRGHMNMRKQKPDQLRQNPKASKTETKVNLGSF